MFQLDTTVLITEVDIQRLIDDKVEESDTLGLREATEMLAQVAPGDVSDAALREALQTWDGCQNRLDAARIGVVAAWDARAVWSAEGTRSGATWLTCHTHQARASAATMVKLGRSLASMPATEAAFAAGDLGLDKARLLAEAAGDAPEAFAADEAMLIGHALSLRVDQLRTALRFWQDQVSADDAFERAARNYEPRRVSLSRTFAGTWHLDGQLTAEDGEILAEALNRAAHLRYKTDKAEADAAGVTVSSTAGQRRADALVDLARQAIANPDGVGMNVAAITALIDVTKLCGTDDTPAAARGEIVGATEAGTPLSADAARRLCCDAHVARIITGPSSTPIDLGINARLPSPAQRRALAARDSGCTFPGCDRPPGWCHAHHITHWTSDGPTDLANLTLLCNFHHHRVHEGGFGLQRQPDDTLAFTRPDGTPLTVPIGNDPVRFATVARGVWPTRRLRRAPRPVPGARALFPPGRSPVAPRSRPGR